jgi:hypothetical protein
MFNKFYAWIGSNIIAIIFALAGISSALTIYNLVDVVRKPSPINIVEGSVQHHLVWDNKKQCYFVRPYSNEVVYLIRVPDCDRI